MKILVINLASIGDCIMRTPLTRALKKLYPGSSIDMLVAPAAAEIARMDANVDHIIVYDRKRTQRGLAGLLKMAQQIRRQSYDMAFCTNYALRGAALTWLAGIKHRYGYDTQHARWFLTGCVAPHPVIQYEAKNQLRILQALTATEFDHNTFMQPSDDDCRTVDKLFESKSNSTKTAIFCPLSNFENRSLPEDIAQRLIADISPVARVIMIGSAAQQYILEAMNSEGKAEVLAGELTLGQLAALIKRSDLMLSVDTGPMHMAVAVDVPVIGLFGANHPDLWGAQKNNVFNFYANSECSPCWGRIYECDRCCLKELDYEAVIEKARQLLGVEDKS